MCFALPLAHSSPRPHAKRTERSIYLFSNSACTLASRLAAHSPSASMLLMLLLLPVLPVLWGCSRHLPAGRVSSGPKKVQKQLLARLLQCVDALLLQVQTDLYVHNSWCVAESLRTKSHLILYDNGICYVMVLFQLPDHVYVTAGVARGGIGAQLTSHTQCLFARCIIHTSHSTLCLLQHASQLRNAVKHL